METIKLVVNNLTEEIIKLSKKYNESLGKVENDYRLRYRLLQLLYELEYVIPATQTELERQERELTLLQEWLDQSVKTMNSAIEEYQNVDNFMIDDVIQLRESVEDTLDDYYMLIKDSADMTREFKQKIRDFNNYKLSYEKYIEQINDYNESIHKEVQNLKLITQMLERRLGYSIGGHMIDWCYSEETENLVETMPQLRYVEIVVKKPKEMNKEGEKEAETVEEFSED